MCEKRIRNSNIRLFQNIELLWALPEWKVSLPSGSRPSQNDIFVLAKVDNQLVSITVEGKVSEPFAQTIGEWRKDSSREKKPKLKFLLDKLQLDERQIDNIRFQLLH